MKKLSIPQLFTLNAYWLGQSFLWNCLHPIILPAILLNYVADERKNTVLGLLTFAGLVLAMVVQPLVGARSDSFSSRWGRRRPFVVAGTLVNIIFLSIIAYSGGIFWLIVGYFGLQISSNFAQAPMQGLTPDRVPKEQMGSSASIQTLFEMLALVLATLLAGRLMDSATGDASRILGVIIVVMLVATSVTVFGTRESPSPSGRGARGEGEINTSYIFLIAQRGLFLLGAYGVQAFAQYYLQDVLRVPDPPKQTGDLLAAIVGGLILLVPIGGWLTDRYGAKRVLYAASILTTLGLLLMYFARDMSTLTIFAIILGAGVGLFLTSNWALANTLAPTAQAGKFLGLANLATAGANALARLEGPAIDALNAAAPGKWHGYTALFMFGALCTFASMFLLGRIQVPEKM